MLTIENINKLTIGTLLLGDKNKEFQEWDMFDIVPFPDVYKIKLKCIRCSPAGPVLGSNLIICLYREKRIWGLGGGGYKLYCPQLTTNTYISPEDMKAPGVFIGTLLKWIDNKLVVI